MGIKSNIIYNSVLTLSQYVIGLITFPYVSRVLGVSNIGVVSFVDNTINYFVLFSTLGISIIGTREIAKYRNNAEKLNSVFSSLVALFMIYTSIVLFAYIIAVTYITKLNIHKELFYIGTAKLIFSVFLIEWFYRGIENFKYITLRNIALKLIYVCSLFIFVKTKDDYVVYFILTTGVVVINAVINILYAQNFVKFSFKIITLLPYFKQSLFLGSYFVLTSMYSTFNVMYLGLVSDTTQVGLYWTALTLYSIILGFFSAFTGVMLPSMSSLLAQGNDAKFKQMIDKSFNIISTICFPLIFVSIMLAPQIINILSGPEYSGAIIPMQIIMLLILVVGVAQILAAQVLMPLRKDKLILTASIIGASVGIILNLILVKTFGSTGTAIVLLISETSVTSYYIYVVSKNKIFNFPWQIFAHNLLYSIPYVFVCYLSSQLFDKPIFILMAAGFVSFTYFVLINIYILKNAELLGILHSIRNTNTIT